ncbi:MAG: 3'-phosphoesterase [Bacteroidota bacterium]|nr:3'-phosphoesterase [Bacteroidota bacterium]
MSLDQYHKKRNFKQTSEPRGIPRSSESSLTFVVHRHKARQLHYDFRLELDGVLKSWAVPRGPSLNPHDKRLAVRVEDHPYEYRDFSGVIPEGNYGAGIVEIWDQGTYSDIDESGVAQTERIMRQGLQDGNIHFLLHGKKLKGEFALVQLKGKSSRNWLLIKHHDAHAVETPYDAEADTPRNSPINQYLREHTQK